MLVKNAGPSLYDKSEMLEAIKGILDSVWLTTGEYNEKLESEFAKSNGVRYGVSCNSGGMALALLLALLRKERTTLFVPANTHVATVSAGLLLGYEVVVCDVTSEMMLDINDPVFRPDSKSVVILVSIAGFLPSNTIEIETVVANSGAVLLVDAAHAHGSKFCCRGAGSFGLASTFSFYPTKLVVAGEGGMVLTDSRELNTRLLRARDVGKVSNAYDKFVESGFSARMSNVLACIGWFQLQHIEDEIERRRWIVDKYKSVVGKSCPILEPPGNDPNWYKFVLLFPRESERSRFDSWMMTHGIEVSSKVFPVPLTEQPIVLEKAKITKGQMASVLSKTHSCLPLYIGMDDSKVEHVLDVVSRFFA